MKIVIGGAGEVGSHLARLLGIDQHQITVIDHDEDRLHSVSEVADLVTIEGLTTSIETLSQAQVEKADLYIAVSPSENQDMNIVSAALAKRMGAKKVTARINNEEYLKPENQDYFMDLGIDYLFYPERVAAHEIAKLLQQTGTSEFMDFSGGKLKLLVFKLEEGAPVIDRTLIDVLGDNTTELSYRAVAISRNGETIIPRGNTEFRLDDTVYVITLPSGEQEALVYSGKSHIDVKNVMILGGSNIAEIVARKMTGIIDNIKIIEPDRDRCEYLAEVLPETLIVNGDVHNTDLLIEEELRRMDAFVAVSGSSETNILSCVVAKRLGVRKTIAEIENLDYIRLAESMGIDTVINKKLITASRIFRFTMAPNVQTLRYLHGADAEILEFVVKQGSPVTKGKIKDIGFPKNAVIGGVIRGNSGFIAVGNTEIKPYDRAVVFALPSAVNKVSKFFGSET